MDNASRTKHGVPDFSLNDSRRQVKIIIWNHRSIMSAPIRAAINYLHG